MQSIPFLPSVSYHRICRSAMLCCAIFRRRGRTRGNTDVYRRAAQEAPRGASSPKLPYHSRLPRFTQKQDIVLGGNKGVHERLLLQCCSINCCCMSYHGTPNTRNCAALHAPCGGAPQRRLSLVILHAPMCVFTAVAHKYIYRWASKGAGNTIVLSTHLESWAFHVFYF